MQVDTLQKEYNEYTNEYNSYSVAFETEKDKLRYIDINAQQGISQLEELEILNNNKLKLANAQLRIFSQLADLNATKGLNIQEIERRIEYHSKLASLISGINYYNSYISTKNSIDSCYKQININKQSKSKVANLIIECNTQKRDINTYVDKDSKLLFTYWNTHTQYYTDLLKFIQGSKDISKYNLDSNLKNLTNMEKDSTQNMYDEYIMKYLGD